MVSIFLCAAGFGFSDARVLMIPKIQGLPNPHPLAISGDGKTVVGQFSPGNPFIWRGHETARFRPSSNAAILDQYAQGISDNGSTIVGKAGGAYFWTRSNGIHTIGDSSSYAFGVSENASTVACQVEGKKNSRGFIWTKSTTINLTQFSPTCISGNGKVVAGIHTEHGSVRACYFHHQVSEQLPLPAEFTDSAVFAVSRDGSVIVGDAFNNQGTFAALWHNGRFLKLDNLGQPSAVAKAITRDGSYLGGYAGSEAVVWTPDGKAIYLEIVLKHSRGCISGWKFESINGMSRVGHRVYVTGWAHLNGQDVGYYASFHVK
jgi:uncharacterized membrane protein